MAKDDLVPCGDCVYWILIHGHPADPDLAFCVLNPRQVIAAPTAVIGTGSEEFRAIRHGGTLSVYPVQARDDSCAQGKAKK